MGQSSAATNQTQSTTQKTIETTHVIVSQSLQNSLSTLATGNEEVHINLTKKIGKYIQIQELIDSSALMPTTMNGRTELIQTDKSTLTRTRTTTTTITTLSLPNIKVTNSFSTRTTTKSTQTTSTTTTTITTQTQKTTATTTIKTTSSTTTTTTTTTT